MIKASPHATLIKLRANWRRFVTNHTSKAELAACRSNELQHIPHNIGLSPASLRSPSCSHPGPSVLMPRRLQQLGLDPAYVRFDRTATYRDLERVCALCKAWRRCARDLAKDDVQAGMSSYCLNAFTIDTLTVDWPESPKH
jgi:hypothetical protein